MGYGVAMRTAAGKGSIQRPADDEALTNNWEATFGAKPRKSREHIMDPYCWCRPELIVEGDTDIYVHNDEK